MLDVDIVAPNTDHRVVDGVSVENIVYTNRKTIPRKLTIFVHNYSHRGGTSGFSAEIEFDGQVFEYEYRKNIPNNAKVEVAHVTFDSEKFSIEHALPSSMSSREIWNLKTNQFHPVSVVCFSPNYWYEQGIGNRHYLFMLQGCTNPEQPNGFFNEYLRQDLLEQKRVFAALGNKMRVEQSETQLSGVGFSSTQRNSLTVKVDGKAMKIIF